MRYARMLALTLASAVPALAGLGQDAQRKPDLLLYHPSGPPLSYEVATIRLMDPDTANRLVKLPPGSTLSPLSLRRYIMDAYGAVYPAQVVGGPSWIDKDAYNIKGKVPDDLEAAQQAMRFADSLNQKRAMQQSLLADRFHFKAHFESRVLPVEELVPAKGGLRITAVPAPPEHKPGDPPIRVSPDQPLPPGSIRSTFLSNGLRTTNAHAIQMPLLARVLGSSDGVAADRPIVDHTGFTGYFDIRDLQWAPLGDAGATSGPDAPSLIQALEEKLGLKLVPGKDPIEVLVIDSIDRPTEN